VKVGRSFAALALGAVLALAPPGAARADGAEPTDYRSEVVSMTPAVRAVEVDIVGGDAFVRLRVAPGHEVMVLGYRSEPFIRIHPDGRVEENRASPSWALSQDRFPSGRLPDDVGVDLAPRWVEVAADGTWVWHDHRTHWMGTSPPMGLGPGDEVADGVVELIVDGDRVAVRVVSVWQQPPSAWPASIGSLLGLGAASVCVVRRRSAPLVGCVTAAAALVVGTWQHLSLPSATRAFPIEWMLPAMALAAGIVAIGAARRRPPAVLVVSGASVVVAAELGLWAVRRRDVLRRAVLPTEAPAWLDRAVTAFVLVVAVGIAWCAVTQLLGLVRPRRSAEGFDVVDDPGDLGVRQRVPGHHERVARDTLG
jgi:hypothetical protein